MAFHIVVVAVFHKSAIDGHSISSCMVVIGLPDPQLLQMLVWYLASGPWGLLGDMRVRVVSRKSIVVVEGCFHWCLIMDCVAAG